MAPLMKFAGVAALLFSAAIAAPLKHARDVVTDVETVTETDMTYVTDYVTVTAGGVVSLSAAATVAMSAAPASETDAIAGGSAANHFHSVPAAPQTHTVVPVPAPAETSSVAPPPSSSSAPAPVSSAPAPAPTSAAPAPTSAAPVSSAPAPAPTSAAPAPTSTAPAPSQSAAPKGNALKRGLAYNDVSLTGLFKDASMVGWAYNWVSSPGGSLASSLEYIPMLWGATETYTDSWKTNADEGIANGATALMSFNEPDDTEQSNMTPAAAAAGYKTWMMPYAGKVQLGSPSVTNGGGSMGLTWLSDFMTACDGCQIDFVNIHWYDSATNVQYFKDHVTQAHTQSGKPVWLTEFGATGSDDQISSFLSEVIPWLEAQDFVQRYAYYMVGNGFLVENNALSSYGHTYAATS